MKISFSQQNVYLKRINEIYKVLKKNDFGYLIEENTFLKKFPFLRNRKKEEVERFLDESVPSRLRMVFEDLGPAYIKLGQMLSTRPDLVGFEIAKELEQLRDSTPLTSFDTILSIIEEELDEDPFNIFESIDEVPLGSASIGQVHKAVLKENGDEVAIKIQKPNIEEVITSDIKIMKFLVNTIDKYIAQTQAFNLPGIVNEFERAILKEIDYTEEVRNMEHLSYNFKKDKTVHVPFIYEDYCTEKIIVMELIKGKEVSKIVLLDDDDEEYDKKLIAERGLNSYFKQVILDGFFHADPHPGNIIVMEDNIICYIDMGMMGILTEEFRRNLAQLFITLVSKDTSNIINHLEYMGIIEPRQITSELKSDVNELMNKYYSTKLAKNGSIFEDLLKIMIKHQVPIPREFVNIGRGLTLIQEVGLKLDPDFTPEKEVKRLSRRIILKRYSFSQISKDLMNFSLEIQHLTKNLPDRLNSLLYKVEDGELTVKLEIVGLSHVIDEMAFSLIIAALIVGSSFTLMSGIGPSFWGIPIIGIIGFLLSAALGFYVIIRFMERSF